MRSARVERVGVHVEAPPCRPRSAGRARRPALASPSGGPASSAWMTVRVRWRRSASVPVSTARPSRMMVTRSQSASTSARMWLDSSTVRSPRRFSSRMHLAEHLLHQRVQAGGRLVQDQQLDVGGERGDERHLLPVALGVGAALLARVELEPLQQLVAALRGPVRRAAGRAGRSPRRRRGSATASRRPARTRAAGAARSRPATGRRRAASPCRRRRASARAGSGWWWSCRRRWGRGSRAPPRCVPAGRARPARRSGRTA